MRSILLISVLSLALCAGVVAQKPSSEVIIIPVVVHVVYNNPQQNISDEQIHSQIAVLNRDYRKTNTDAVNVPVAFKGLAADAKIEFRLATANPIGATTNGIIRKSTSSPSFTTDDKIKSSLTGGDDAWDRNQYLNLWVGSLSGGILGYASSPGCAAQKDGVVIRYDVFGTTGLVRAPFNKGRTATHEIGHWLGLRHIWGDASCGDDKIDDTPTQPGPTRGCPSGFVPNCDGSASGSMYMNFMDFTDDACTNMFTAGQVAKMRSLFDGDGQRAKLLSSDKAVGLPEVQAQPGTVGGITVYPNPATSEVRISFNDQVGVLPKSVTVYDHLGQLVKQAYVTKNVLTLDLTGLNAGMYFISCGGVSRKLIKVN